MDTDRPVNFRDFGGGRTRDGRRVILDRLYRCGQLRPAGEACMAMLGALDFGLVADLRHPSEQRRAPVPWPVAPRPRLICNTTERTAEAPHVALLRTNPQRVEEVDRFYESFYASLPFQPAYRALFVAVLSALAEDPGRTLIYCSGGKDRTGILAVFVLEALGVLASDIEADYMKSGDPETWREELPRLAVAFERRYGYRTPNPVIVRLMGTQPAYLAALRAALTERCGSVLGYLDTLGIDAAVRRRVSAQLTEVNA